MTHARRAGKSVSQVVAEYFSLLGSDGAQAIVTRNSRDFHGSAVPVHSPADMLAILAALEGAGDSGRADGPGRRSN